MSAEAKMAAIIVIATVAGLAATPQAAEAQTIGTFRWNTAPYCNVLVLTVTQVTGSTFAFDGYDEQCGGNPRQPVHGTGVLQASGSLTFGLSVVPQPGTAQPVGLRASLNLATISGTWEDGGGSSGTLAFNPGAVTGGPRPLPATPQQLPPAFAFLPQGGFVAEQIGSTNEAIPASGQGTRMMFWAARGAFRSGRVSTSQWDPTNIGLASTAFGSDTIANGPYALASGLQTIAAGIASTALGARATAAHDGAFVVGDLSTATPVSSTAPNQFVARAAGGVRFYTNSAMSAGVSLPAGAGSWVSLSDVHRKANFRDLDGDDVLGKLAAMPIREWNYTSQPATVRHVGPTAQDFRRAFGLGDDPLGISTVDGIGVALRAVQALEARTRQLDERNQQLEHANGELRERVLQLERRRDQ